MKSNSKSAIFPGSFDPFTLGHMDVLQSALKLFDKIFIAVGYNHLKHGFLSPGTRVSLITDAVRPLVEDGADIKSTRFLVEFESQRMMVRDTDIGEQLQTQVDDLKRLLQAYRLGVVK